MSSSSETFEITYSYKKTMTTRKLYGKDLSEYEDVDIEDLLEQLSSEEIDLLAREVDPDDALLPPDQRCSYQCCKPDTGKLNRKQLIDHIKKQAMEEPDRPEAVPYVPGKTRGKRWIPPEKPMTKQEEEIAIDLGEEYEGALSGATEEELVDLAAVLGFHSMMNQDQYHASLLNKEKIGIGWGGITKSSKLKTYPMEPPNQTDPEEAIRQLQEDNPELNELNLNNIKNVSEEKFERLLEALKSNTQLECLSLSSTGINDRVALKLVETLERNSSLRVVSVESNFISPPVIVKLLQALLVHKTIEEFRASNQRSQVLGNKIEMEITDIIEQNPTILRLGLHLEFNDARNRVATHLQKNLDRRRHRVNVSFTLRLQPTRATDISEDLETEPKNIKDELESESVKNVNESESEQKMIQDELESESKKNVDELDSEPK